MRNTSNRIAPAAACLATLTSAAMAGPPASSPSPPLGPAARAAASGGVGIDGLWAENFDTYAVGPLSGQGGWAPWTCPTPGLDGQVNSQFAASPPRSFRAGPLTDMVRQFSGATSGQWEFKMKTYVSSNASGTGTQDGYIIVLNNYCPSLGNQDWSITVRLSALLGTAATWTGGTYTQSLPLVFDDWAEYRAEIDLTADTLTEYYDGVLLGTNTWTGNIAPGGMPQIVAVDLFSDTLDSLYFDDLSLSEMGGCYPDCNNSGTLTIADFGCFQAAFAAGNMYADCNNSGTLTIADFGCFQAAFAAGCP